MLNSKKLWNDRNGLVEKMTAAMNDENMDDAHRFEGEIRAIDKMIAEALEEEEQARLEAAPKVAGQERTFAQILLGEKASFDELKPGWKNVVPIKDAITGLNTPQIYRRELPAPVAAPTGFLQTIQHGTTDGDEHFFKTPVLDNKAASWTTGNKPESALTWAEGTAPLDTIAHWIPIKKQTARRYNTLETIVRGSLMMGLDLKADELALRGKNSNGITGVCETDGILSHTKESGKNIKDTINAMKRKVRVATGIAPNYVCFSPYAIEELSEEKDNSGRYLFPDLKAGDSICGLTIVEDVNMTTEDKETALVYYSGGASWDIADPEEVTIGLTNSQFIQNEYTVLAEFTAALRVDMPGAFCYCDDLGLTVEPAALAAKASVKVDK